MITLKSKSVIQKMEQAGRLLAGVFEAMKAIIVPGLTTLELDIWITEQLKSKGLISKTKGYMGYRHVSCISINDEVVHGVPEAHRVIRNGDVVKVDVCASYKGYCADMARIFLIGDISSATKKMVEVTYQALDKGIEQALVGNRLCDISAAIQKEIEKHGFGVVRDFAGHGIGKQMHEEPEILNYGEPGCGPVLREGMTFAIEPMATMGKYQVYVAPDGWTVKTVDKTLATHVEDTIAITAQGPRILTRSV